MGKPIILKQKFRFGWFWALWLALQIGLWVWGYSRDSASIWFWLPTALLLNVSPFFERVVLEDKRVTVQLSLTDVRRFVFVRIARYLIKPGGDRLDVELTLEALWPQRGQLFGIELPSWRNQTPSLQERQVSFSLDLEQSDVLMNYLHHQDAVADVLAEIERGKLQILLATGREIKRLNRKYGKSSSDEIERLLAQTEAELSEAERM